MNRRRAFEEQLARVPLFEGEVEVRHGDEVLARLGPGDCLGEVALRDADARRSATAVATTAVVIAFIGRHDFDQLLAGLPVLAARVNATIDQRRPRLPGTESQ